MKLPLAGQLELDTLLANRSPISQLPYLGPKIKILKPNPSVSNPDPVHKPTTFINPIP
jgi:hypothetical protein